MARITMDSIAKELGVSKSLVSLAISNKYGVNDETRSKIILYALKNNYNFERVRAHKDLKNKRNEVFVFLREKDLDKERFWPEILVGVERMLKQNKCQIVIKTWNEEDEPTSMMIDIINSEPRGIIIFDIGPSMFLEYIKQLRTPTVLVDSRNMLDASFDTVRVNNYSGGYAGAKYLVEKGHKRLMFVGDCNYSFSFLERYYGFKDYIEQQTKDVQLYVAIGRGNNISNEYEKIVNVNEINWAFDGSEKFPTAIMCANDPIAFITMDVLKKRGIRIPQDVSILGFDNIVECNHSSPTLSSLNVPKVEMGYRAVQLLVEKFYENKKSKVSISLSTTVVERESVISI